jgi:hypothetical protein
MLRVRAVRRGSVFPEASRNREREYRFANGCTVVLQASRAVLVREGAVCELHHRDIALLYALAD